MTGSWVVGLRFPCQSTGHVCGRLFSAAAHVVRGPPPCEKCVVVALVWARVQVTQSVPTYEDWRAVDVDQDPPVGLIA